MSSVHRKRNRGNRVTLEMGPGRFEEALAVLQRRDVVVRLALAVAALVLIAVLCRAWAPSRSYRLGFVPPRNITAEVAFKQPDPDAHKRAVERARQREPYVFENDPKDLQLLQAAVKNAVGELVQAQSYAEVNLDLWKAFQGPQLDSSPVSDVTEQEKNFDEFRKAVGDQTSLASFELALVKAFTPFERYGLLDKLPSEADEPMREMIGNQKEIVVYPLRKPEERHQAIVDEVLIGQGEAVHKGLKENLPPVLSTRVFNWIKPRLRPTLRLDMEETQKARDRAAALVPMQFVHYEAGKTIAPAGRPLDESALKLLKLDHDELVAQWPWASRVLHASAMLFAMATIFGLCGLYIRIHNPPLLAEVRRFGTLLAAVIAVVTFLPWTSSDIGLAELVPLLLFGTAFTIGYQRDLAMVLSVSLAALVTLASGESLSHFLLLVGVVAATIVQLDSIRTRSKLIQVGAISAAVALMASVVIGVLDQQPLLWHWTTDVTAEPGWALWRFAFRNALWTLAAGFLLTGLLPMIERWFGVLTDLSLLEWGDVSHPLLQQLVQRAPGTYNHSINVASIAEAAAEAVGANGLLVRVGAYFHDIGKMLKPDYYVENQSAGANRHDTLVPAMSTLIIIAHVKDGADLARQHHLPQAIIDFIEQHHGTTLVEYFFHRANEQLDEDVTSSGLHESSYRYPGPKPQSIEAAVLMLADSVESASRALVEPTPSRIDNLVEDISLKKLLDGQFDECGLTLEQLRTIEDSLSKSLTAVYHGRVKYTTQQTA